MSNRWHILRDGEGLTLARHLPPRFDFSIRTPLGPGDALRLAHQIRQDLWRALQRVRGFSPVVQLTPRDGGWDVVAGGRTSGPLAPRQIEVARNVLEHPQNKARWQRHAMRGMR
ncbi:MAG: hypothetical protein AAFU86_01640 [Pseudomonadota bacterium]